MQKKYKKALFIFRRDLRLGDNTGLLQALEAAEEVLLLFIFDNKQIDSKKNEYFGAQAFRFMHESLVDLSDRIQKRGGRLYVCQGEYTNVVDSFIANDAIDAVFVNKDYTPFSRKRDGAVDAVCKKHDVPFVRANDYALSPIEDIRTGSGDPYTVFTPFMKKAIQHEVSAPHRNLYKNYYSGTVHTNTIALTEISVTAKNNSPFVGGRTEAKKLLRDTKYLPSYKARRDFPAQKGTSQLSPHHKFGTISIRETYAVATSTKGASEQFIAELYWRDFYLHIAYHFPHVFKGAFLPWGNYIPWENNEPQFIAWKEGKTGVPIVDAGIRQLLATGWMHNRVRMIVASFLSKNLLINWQWGEQFFAHHLVDYDPASNNGGWQWSASVGADPRPLRIFNPYTQAQKYDPDAAYIQQWVPELQGVDPALLTDGKERDFSTYVKSYPAPIVSAKETYHRAREAYKMAKQQYEQAQ